MKTTESSYSALRLNVMTGVVRHTLLHGSLVPLTVLWGFGAILLGLVLAASGLTVAWTLAVLGIAAGMIVGAWRNDDILHSVLMSMIERHLKAGSLQGGLRQEVLRCAARFTQIVLLIHRREKGSAAESIERGLANMYAVLTLHAEALHSSAVAPDARQGIGDELESLLTTAQRVTSEGLATQGMLLMRAGKEFLAESEASLARALSLIAVRPIDRKADRDAAYLEALWDEVPPELRHLKASLLVSFSKLTQDTCLGALQHLNTQYDRLLLLFARKRETEPLAVGQLPHLAQEAYRQALSVLQDALGIAQAIESPERERLEQEVTTLAADVLALTNSRADSGRLKLREERLQSHHERLRALAAQEFALEELLHECERCEAALEKTRMELASLKGETSGFSITVVTDSLRTTVEQARSVQAELMRLRS
jgi:hypothetical protein